MLMYTSCGWFFDEPTGPETVQVLQYAARAVQLGQQLFGGEWEQEFLRRLRNVHSNISEFGSGSDTYERFVRPAMLDLPGVAAHYAISSFFEGYQQAARIYSYRADLIGVQKFEAGRLRLATGHARITSRVTQAQLDFNFAVVYSGAHNLVAGICPAHEEFGFFIEQLRLAAGLEFDDCVRLVRNYFGPEVYSLRSLFHDERRRILGQIVDATLSHLDEFYRDVYEHNTSLIGFLRELRLPLPPILQVSSEFMLQNSIRRALSAERIDFTELRNRLERSQREDIRLDPNLKSEFCDRLNQLMKHWAKEPFNVELLGELQRLVGALRGLGFEANLWIAQNVYYEVMISILALSGSEIDPRWASLFHDLGAALGIAVPPLRASTSPQTTDLERVDLPKEIDANSGQGYPCAV
jgi:hypothetical protein